MKTAAFHTLGCKVNQYDTQAMLEKFRAAGYEIVPFDADADVYVINTCTVTGTGDKKSLQLARRLRREHPDSALILAGCLAQRKPEDLLETGARLVIGTQHRGEVVELLEKALRENTSINAVNELHATTPFEPLTITSQEEHTRATLKIQEGCNNHCTFCIIPDLRGDLVSRSIGDVLREAENLVKGGVKELLVISQDTAAYGLDVKYRTGFAGGRPVMTRLLELARELGKLDAWVRLHYVYPYPSTDAVVELMAEGLILPYLDVPFQHAHPRVLKAMKRPASAEKNLERIAAWRAVCPDITIRSTFITGFPGETEEEFEYLLDFLREARLDRVGCFAYSPVEGAQANALPGQLPDEVREERRRRFMEVQAEISAEILRQKVGTVKRVIIDEPEDEDGVAVGRCARH